jgi:hypothetical protein
MTEHNFDEGIPGDRGPACRRCGQDARCTTLPCPTTFDELQEHVYEVLEGDDEHQRIGVQWHINQAGDAACNDNLGGVAHHVQSAIDALVQLKKLLDEQQTSDCVNESGR